MADTTSKPSFELGTVISRTFGVLRRRFLPFVGLALIFVGIPGFIDGLLEVERAVQARSVTLGGSLTSLVINIVEFVITIILQIMLVSASLADLEGRKPKMVESFRTGLRRFWPVLAASMLAAVAMVLGLLIFIVPGVLMMLAWVVITPVIVNEGRGPISAFERSAELTRGRRFGILALLVAWLIATVLVGGTVGAVLGVLVGAALGDSPPHLGLLADAIATPVGSSLGMVLGATSVAALYHELRRTREGLGPDQTAAIFD